MPRRKMQSMKNARIDKYPAILPNIKKNMKRLRDSIRLSLNEDIGIETVSKKAGNATSSISCFAIANNVRKRHCHPPV